MLCRLCRTGSTVNLPATFKHHLEQIQVDETALTLIHTHELTRICNYLTAQHIAFVVHKGTTLATLGYHIENRDYERINREFTGEVTLVKRTNYREILVDLHMEFTANAWGRVTGFDLADFWNMRSTIELDGAPVPPLLNHLSLHAFCHVG